MFRLIGRAVQFISGIKQNITASAQTTLSNVFRSLFFGYEEDYGKTQEGNLTTQVNANKGWVFACIGAISDSVAMSKLKVYQKGKDGQENEIKEHIFLDLWNNINPIMDGFFLRKLTAMYLEATGNAYWFVVKNKMGQPQELWPWPSQYMKVIPDAKGLVQGYLWDNNNVKVAFEADEIIHIKYPNMKDLFYGASPLLAAAYAADADEYIGRYQMAVFKNMARPEGYLATENDIDEKDAKLIMKMWKKAMGGVDKAGKTTILKKGLKYEAISLPPREMAFISSSSMNRDKILGIFRVSRIILGLEESASRANAEAAEYVYGKYTISPKLIMMEEVINQRLVPMFTLMKSGKMYVKYEHSIPEDKEYELKKRDTYLKDGVYKINEIRAEEGKEPVPWGEEPYKTQGTGLIPTGLSLPSNKKKEDKKNALYRQRTAALINNTITRDANLMQRDIKSEFGLLRKRVVDNLNRYFKELEGQSNKLRKKELVDVILFNEKEAEEEFKKIAEKHIPRVYEAGAKHGIALADLDINFSINNPYAQEFIKARAFAMSKYVPENLYKEVRTSLNEGMEKGESLKDLTARINDKLGWDAADWKGRRIAMTEAGNAVNNAMSTVWKVSGKVENKEWLHGGGGEHPRAEHEAHDGDSVGINDHFWNGLEYPHDPNGPPEEVINCTCSILPVVSEEAGF